MLLLTTLALAADLATVVAGYPAPPRASVAENGTVYVLLNDGTVDIWSGEPGQKQSSSRVAGATGLFQQAGIVWVVTVETRAVPLSDAPAGGPVLGGDVPPPGSTPAQPPMLRSIAHVESVDNGVARINLGSRDGLSPGSEVRVLANNDAGEERLVATGRVRATELDRAVVDLSRGGRVEVGNRVVPTDREAGLPIAPPRLGGVREVGLVLRPVLPLGTVGVAFVNDAWFTWRFESPWYAEARVSPFGLGWSTDGNPITVAATLAGGYDSRYFSVGLGAGWSMYNADLANYGYSEYAADSGTVSGSFNSVEDTLAIVQEARLGAHDGLSLEVRNTFLLVPEYTTVRVEDDNGEPVLDENGYETWKNKETGESFNYGGLALRANIPTGLRTDLFVDASFGDAGCVVVEGGVSTWLRGNGDRGSLGLQVGAGYGQVAGAPDDEPVTLAGPLVSVGGRARF